MNENKFPHHRMLQADANGYLKRDLVGLEQATCFSVSSKQLSLYYSYAWCSHGGVVDVNVVMLFYALGFSVIEYLVMLVGMLKSAA